MAQLLDTVIAARCQSARNFMSRAKSRLLIQAALLTGGIALMVSVLIAGLPAFSVYICVIICFGSLLWFFLGTTKKGRTFHAEWCRAEMPWLRLQSLLLDLPLDWAILQYGGIPIVAGPSGAIAVAPGADLPGESENDVRDAVLASLAWAENICRSARLPGEPIGLLVHDNPRGGPEVGRIGTVTSSRLSMHLLEMPRVWSPSDLRVFVDNAVGSSSEARPVWAKRPARTASARAGRTFGRMVRRFGMACAAVAVGVALVAGIRLLWPSAIARLVYSGQTYFSAYLPADWLKLLHIPMIENVGEDDIVGTVKKTCVVVERVGGGRPAGRLSGGENVIILDQAFAGDSQNAPWIYIRTSTVEGWVLQSAVFVTYLPAGIKFFEEADERLGDAGVIITDTPAVLTRRRGISGKKGSIWWEFWAPGARRGWIHSDTNPLAGVSREGQH